MGLTESTGTISLTAAQCLDTTNYATGAMTYQLPSVSNFSLTYQARTAVITRGAVQVKIKPQASEIIYLNGVPLTAGYLIVNTSTSGDQVIITCDGTYWYVWGLSNWTGSAS
jgi:hypothetical protein